MSVLQGVLKEEIERLEKVIVHYNVMLQSLPRGSIFKRKIGNSFYVYRKRRENGVVVSEYLGKEDEENAKRQIELSKEYHRVKKNLRDSVIELSKLKRAYMVYEN